MKSCAANRVQRSTGHAKSEFSAGLLGQMRSARFSAARLLLSILARCQEVLLAYHAGGTDAGKLGLNSHAGEERIGIHRRPGAIVSPHGELEQSQSLSGLPAIREIGGGKIVGFRILGYLQMGRQHSNFPTQTYALRRPAACHNFPIAGCSALRSAEP